MAHEITDTDGVFSVREQLWHGLGDVLDHYPTREEAKKIAHPWEPITEPLYRRVPIITAGEGLTERYDVVPDRVAVVRDDNNVVLGTVSDTFSLVSNNELYDIAEALQSNAPEDVRYETGGSLMGGSMVWLLLRLNEPIVVKGDPNGATIVYYGLQNRHDGLGALRGQGTNVRICCANTSRAADMDSRAHGTEFVFRHTKNVKDRIEEAKAALAGWRESVEEWKRITELLLTIPVTRKQRELFVTEFVPMPVKGVISDRVANNVETARSEIRNILASPTCEGIDLTAYGLVQAATEYGQHVRRTNSTRRTSPAESRFKRAYLDNDRLAGDAVTLAKEVATVY